MSDKEKALAKQIAALPEELQEKFLDQARGAAMALDMLDKRKEDPQDAANET